MFGRFRKRFDLEAYVEGSVEGLRSATAAHTATWHLGEEEAWDVAQEDGEIVFTFADGTVAIAPVQIVGTYNEDDGTFLWGWDHPSVEPALQQHAATVKAFGEDKRIDEFTSRKVDCTEERAWAYTAVAMRLGEASGAYRGEAGPGTLVFMTFGEVRLHRDDA